MIFIPAKIKFLLIFLVSLSLVCVGYIWSIYLYLLKALSVDILLLSIQVLGKPLDSFHSSIAIYRIVGFFARPNFCKASISLSSSNICDYYICEAIHSSNHMIAWRSSFLNSKMPEVEFLSYLWLRLHKDAYDGSALLQSIDWSAVLSSQSPGVQWGNNDRWLMH